MDWYWIGTRLASNCHWIDIKLAQDGTPDWDGLALDRHWIGILLASDLNLSWRWIGTASVPDWDRCAPYWHRIETGLGLD